MEILVQDHTAYILFIYSSGSGGEYFESSMRRGSSRGLTLKKAGKSYTNVSSRKSTHCFQNEKGEAETEEQVIRDAKGFSTAPLKRLL